MNPKEVEIRALDIPEYQKDHMIKCGFEADCLEFEQDYFPQNIHQKTDSPFLYEKNIGKIICYDCECWGVFAGQLGCNNQPNCELEPNFDIGGKMVHACHCNCHEPLYKNDPYAHR